MIKKFLTILILFNSASLALAQNQPIQSQLVRITPCEVITTSKNTVQEGDYVNFKVINNVYLKNGVLKKDDVVKGVVTQRQENDFCVQPASLYIEDFKTISGMEIKGIVYKKGSTHNKVLDSFFASFTDVIKGGEVNIVPEKDVFTLEIEDK